MGYYGNPKIKGIDLFDGSQSISSVKKIPNLEIYKNLRKLNFSIVQVTIGETFDDSVYGPNPIPREYAFDPVDERVNIYSTYNDDLYEEFINQGKAIHDKYNKENYCNPKNPKLLFHVNNCPVKGKEHAYGGYKCKSDKNEWNKTECQAYYCDIGFYYNQYEQKCMEECSFNNAKTYLINGDVDDKIYNIEKNIITTFIVITNSSDDYYFYNSSLNTFTDFPKIGVIHFDILHLNKDKEAENNYEFRLSKIKSDIAFLTYKNKSINENYISIFLNIKKIMFLQVSEDHIFYGYNPWIKIQNRIQYAKYNEQMKLDDILEGNENYFKEYKYENDFIIFQKDETYILSMEIYGQLHYFISPKNVKESIDIIGTETNFLFLEKNKIYELDFKNNTIDRLINLSRKTLNSQINIIDENIILNSDNIYYQIKEGFKGKLKLEVENSDAVIEFLFKLNKVNQVKLEKNMTINMTKETTIIIVSNEIFSKILNFHLKSEKNLKFNIFFVYSKPPYSYYYPGNTNQLSLTINKMDFPIFL